MSGPRISRLLATIVALLLGFAASPEAAADDPAPASAASPAPRNPQEETASRLRELGAATQAKIDETLSIGARIETAKGEEKDVLVEQRAARAAETTDLLNTFVTEIVRARDQGDIDDTWVQKASAFLGVVDRHLEAETKRFRAETKSLREAREKASPEEISDIDDNLVRANLKYDQALRTRFETAVAREKLGLDAAEAYSRLDELLKARADERAGQLRVTRRRIADLSAQAAASEEDEAKVLRARILQQQTLLEKRVESLRRLASLLESRSLPSAEYRQLVIEASGQVTVDIFNQEVALALAQQWWKRTRAWLTENATSIVFNLILAFLLLLASHLLGRLTQRIARRALERSRTPVSRLFQEFLLTSVYRVAVGLGLLIALAQVGVDIAPLLAGVGVASFIVGFALQDTLSNFASGMLILAYRPFDVGDIVNAGGVAGRVEAMTLVTTTILTFDNQRLIVPNSKIWGDVITNVTAERVRRIDLMFGISYADDIEHAERVLRDVVAQHEKTLDNPEPNIRLHELGESSVNFIVRPWALTVDYWEVYWDITREVKRRFDAEGISIPFPQRDVHFYRERDAPA